jgi:DinB superfamily
MKAYLNSLENTPKTLVNIVDQVKPDRYTQHTEPDRFNLIEMVAHLADFDDIFLDRLRYAHESPGGVVTSFDPDARAEEKQYGTRDIHHELDVFENRRRDLVEFLDTLGPDDWKKSFVHPDLGEVTIDEYANIILAHDLSHLSHATTYMR